MSKKQGFDRRYKEGKKILGKKYKFKPPGGMTLKQWREYRKQVGLYKPKKKINEEMMTFKQFLVEEGK